jgi:hypothetical protein
MGCGYSYEEEYIKAQEKSMSNFQPPNSVTEIKDIFNSISCGGHIVEGNWSHSDIANPYTKLTYSRKCESPYGPYDYDATHGEGIVFAFGDTIKKTRDNGSNTIITTTTELKSESIPSYSPTDNLPPPTKPKLKLIIYNFSKPDYGRDAFPRWLPDPLDYYEIDENTDLDIVAYDDPKYPDRKCDVILTIRNHEKGEFVKFIMMIYYQSHRPLFRSHLIACINAFKVMQINYKNHHIKLK